MGQQDIIFYLVAFLFYGCALFSAYGVAVGLFHFFIPRFQKWQFVDKGAKKDSVRLDELHAGKARTPTLGGVIIIAGIILCGFLLYGLLGSLDYLHWYYFFHHKILQQALPAKSIKITRSMMYLLESKEKEIGSIIWGGLVPAFMALLSFGALGFWDDWMKLKGRHRALSIKFRLLLEGLIAAGLVFLIYGYAGMKGWVPLYHWPGGYVLPVPFQPVPGLHLGYIGYLIPIFIIVATANAVNITDGLDGLAISTLNMNFIVFWGLAALIIIWIPEDFRSLWQTMASMLMWEAYWPGGHFLLGCVVLGVGYAFYRMNRYPAKIFMGNVGSLALGAFLAVWVLQQRMELLLPLTGVVFVVETVSVILQIIAYRCFGGRRIFAIAPLHHHYQFKGLSETEIVRRFDWLTTGCCLAALVIGFIFSLWEMEVTARQLHPLVLQWLHTIQTFKH